jgi:hypothetical protein
MHPDMIKNELTSYQRLRDEIIQAYELDPEDQALMDTLEGETNLHKILAAFAREIENREAMAMACAELAQKKSDRAKRLMDGAKRMRGLLAETMTEAGIKRLSEADLLVTVRPGKPALKIVDEEQLHPAFTKTTVEIKPDRTKLKAELDRCEAEGAVFAVPGVVVTNGAPVLTIRGS